ncbi:hypothetical protein R1flu_002134 [Riccia fluitans]|uniref:UDP-glucose/GDP-mannose dehydrogenase C-terminal domain-containing protein n=1 Tax=Riccia fluitans TaxID=41844 RepID=A0ABD1Y591_9MARC
MNEVSMILAKLNLDTQEVLAAAGTKWNFLPFRPGLVGGHCIGVDPYYLAHKAQAVGHHPEVILASRRVNANMGVYAASELIKAMIKAGHSIVGAKVLVMGLTFKENCPDIRNTPAMDVVRELKEFGCRVDVTDCWADEEVAKNEYDVELVDCPQKRFYDAVVLTVAHREYCAMTADQFRGLMRDHNGVLFDLKDVMPSGSADLRL